MGWNGRYSTGTPGLSSASSALREERHMITASNRVRPSPLTSLTNWRSAPPISRLPIKNVTRIRPEGVTSFTNVHGQRLRLRDPRQDVPGVDDLRAVPGNQCPVD